jgi:hypothetical protein
MFSQGLICPLLLDMICIHYQCGPFSRSDQQWFQPPLCVYHLLPIEVIRNESVQSRHTARTGRLFRDQLLYPSACFPDLLVLFQQQAPLPPEACVQCSPTKSDAAMLRHFYEKLVTRSRLVCLSVRPPQQSLERNVHESLSLPLSSFPFRRKVPTRPQRNMMTGTVVNHFAMSRARWSRRTKPPGPLLFRAFTAALCLAWFPADSAGDNLSETDRRPFRWLIYFVSTTWRSRSTCSCS